MDNQVKSKEEEIKSFIEQMEEAKIYFVSYGGNVQIVGRFDEIDTTRIIWYSMLHYCNGFENFRERGAPNFSIKSGVTSIRKATKPEAMALIRFELEHYTLPDE